MAIENRNLAVGTKLTAKYKTVSYGAEVVQTEEGVRYKLEDGRESKSLSSAGTAITGGPINGWAFWSVAGEEAQGQPAESKTETPKRSNGVIRRTPNQKGTPEGQVRYFCSACLDSFYAEAGEKPEACPKGHDESFGEMKSDVEAPEELADEAEELTTE